jgi:nitrous oxidase accessory protein NosD
MSAKPRSYAAPAAFVSLAVIVACTVVTLVGSSGAAVAAKQPKCGDKITKDTTLHKDLLDCPNNGIVIGADAITLDLNGHVIDGDGKPAAGCNPRKEFCDVGVVNFRHDRVTVMRGSIRDFGGGVDFGNARHTRLLGISASRGVVGIQFFGSSRILVRNSSGNHTTSDEGAGIGVFDSRHVRILNSSFRHNAHVGIKPVGSTTGVIEGNVVSQTGEEGFLMEGGEGFQITHNRFAGNGAGITLGPGSHNEITKNDVAGGRDGIRIEKGHDNLIAHNEVADTHRAGIRLGIRHPFIGGAHNIVRRNLVRDSEADGFALNKKDGHSLLRGNVAKRSGDDGFDIRSRTATVTGNRALRNDDLGIKAVRGVIDGGGNKASGNGDPRQCTNIACN